MEKNIEFEEMKQQLRVLQQRIDNQVEINDKQTQSAIEDGVGNLRKQDEWKFRFCLIISFLLPFCILTQGLPTSFIITTYLLLIGNAAWRKYLNKTHDKLPGTSLIETSKVLLKYKRDERNSVLIGIPLGILWCVWYIMNLRDLPQFIGVDLSNLYAGLIVGVLLGLIIGLTRFYLPQQRAADRLLRQIEEVQSEK